MLGTTWTAPGEGATVGDLAVSVRAARITDRDRSAACRVIAELINQGATISTQTRLQLTGQPLTGYDIKRIEALL
jgi:hypothetical protein